MPPTGQRFPIPEQTRMPLVVTGGKESGPAEGRDPGPCADAEAVARLASLMTGTAAFARLLLRFVAGNRAQAEPVHCGDHSRPDNVASHYPSWP